MESWKNPKSAASLIDYPPLYSVQLPENQQEQLNIWSDLLVAYVMKSKTWSISLQECPMFTNKKLNREVPTELRMEIINHMIANNRALWIGSSQHSQAYILPKSLTEWEDLVYKRLLDAGTTDPIQAHELIEEIEYSREPFYGMPEELMEHILQRLTKQGKMVTFKVNQDNNYKMNPNYKSNDTESSLST